MIQMAVLLSVNFPVQGIQLFKYLLAGLLFLFFVER